MGIPGFNPAKYARRTGRGEYILDLPAKLLWLNAKYPGYRVTGDGFEVFGIKEIDPDTEGEYVRYFAHGHVAVINAEGVRIISVPASCEMEDGDYAGALFEEGANLALEMLGLNIYNITRGEWREALGLEAARTAAMSGEQGTSEPELPAVLAKSAGGDSDIVSPEDIFPGITRSEPDEPDDDDEDGDDYGSDGGGGGRGGDDIDSVSYDDILKMFFSFCEKHPSTMQGTKIQDIRGNKKLLEKQFERYCYSAVGVSWVTADESDKRTIYNNLKGKS